VLDNGTTVRATVVVNAAGVWADDVRALDEGVHPDSIRPAKGIHVTVPADRLPCDIAAVVPVPKDRRSIFVVPWGDETYIGTTDTDYDGPLEDPECTAEDIAYLLDAINGATTSALTTADIIGTWAGLRPLVKAAASERTADLSRRHVVATSASGVVSVTGGKLTTYRKMAADTVDVCVRLLGRGRRRSPTKRLPIRGAQGLANVHLDVAPDVAEHLIGRHGSEAPDVWAVTADDPSLAEPLVPGLPYLRAEAVWAVREEMASSLEDVLARRTRAQLKARDATEAAADDVAGLIGPLLGWSAEDIAQQLADYRSILARERAAVAT
jgi:glycerol-3-phosphate dehydrogenase